MVRPFSVQRAEGFAGEGEADAKVLLFHSRRLIIGTGSSAERADVVQLVRDIEPRREIHRAPERGIVIQSQAGLDEEPVAHSDAVLQIRVVAAVPYGLHGVGRDDEAARAEVLLQRIIELEEPDEVGAEHVGPVARLHGVIAARPEQPLCEGRLLIDEVVVDGEPEKPDASGVESSEVAGILRRVDEAAVQKAVAAVPVPGELCLEHHLVRRVELPGRSHQSVVRAVEDIDAVGLVALASGDELNSVA